LSRLQSEIRRAQRYGRLLSLITFGVHATSEESRADDANSAQVPIIPTLIDATPQATQPQPVPPAISSTALSAIVKAAQGVLRTHVDWVGRLSAAADTAAFAVILPEAGAADGPTIKERIRRVLEAIPVETLGGQRFFFDFGLASLERGSRDSRLVDAAELVSVAEHCRVCSGHTGSAQLNAVQRSVAVGVTIACRHGYAVASHCSFKAPTPVEERSPEALPAAPKS
jgi:hypothetical protein